MKWELKIQPRKCDDFLHFVHITVRNRNYINLRNSNIFVANTAAMFVQSLA